jgi:hypothetical protein
MKVALAFLFCLGVALARVERWNQYDDTTDGICQVSGRRVKTFDNEVRTIPLTTSYVVLAKDCSSNNFVVLMRKISERTDLKEIKIQTRQHEIVLTPVSKSSKRVLVTVNDRQINLQEDIELKEAGRPVIRIVKEGSQIRVELLNKGINVVFNGYICKVELSQISQKQLCGLCSKVDSEFSSKYNIRDFFGQDREESQYGNFFGQDREEEQYRDIEDEEDCDDYSCSKKRQWGYDKPEWTNDETEEDCDDYTPRTSRRQWGYDKKDWTLENKNRFDNEYNTCDKPEYSFDDIEQNEEDCDDYTRTSRRQWGYDKKDWTFDQTTPFEQDCDDYSCPSQRRFGNNKRDWTFDQTKRFDNEYNTFENREHSFEQNENEYETEFDRSNTNKRPVLKHKLIEHEEKICVSLQRIPECPINTQSEKEVEKRVPFKCLNRNHPLVEKLETKVHRGQPIPLLKRMTPSLTRTVVVPIKCTKLY